MTAAGMDQVTVERLGGFGGFGLPGSHLRSRGWVERAKLSPADRAAVDALFDNPPKGAPSPDGFTYRLTRQTAKGAQTVEVAEQHVPDALKNSVKDELV